MLAPKGGLELAKTVRHYAARICRDGGAVSERDARLLAEVVISRAYLLQDLTDDPHCAEGYWRAIMSLRSLDAKSYAESVKALRAVLLRIMPEYSHGALEGYVRQFKPGVDGIHFTWMVTPLRAIERSHEAEVAVLCNCLEWVSYDTKLNMADADFSEELSVEYLDDEFVMSRFTYDHGLIADLRGVVAEWCEGMTTPPETAPWHFRHGNGATVEVSRAKASPIRKSKYFAVSEDTAAYLEWRGSVEGLSVEDLSIEPYPEEEKPIVVDFVPKSPLTNRVISKEHVSKMWLQNDLFWLMDRMFHESRVNVHLHNQDASRRLALEGSVAGQWDTFDYSKASDFVTNAIVQGITEGTWLHAPLQWSRSKTVTVGESSKKHVGLKAFWGPTTISLSKFAPMGSSTCFPTESMVFAALCEVAIRRKLHRKSRRGDYLVYGDDVVIRSDCSDELRFLSALLHFKVNDDKTCRTTGRFIYREACGIEALNGLDVTPLRVSRRYVGIVNAVSGRSTTPGEFVGIIDFVNRTYLYGFANLRKYLCSMLSLWDKYYAILRVSRSTYSDALKRWKAGQAASCSLPTPFFLTDDMTDTNYRVPSRFRLEVPAKSRASCYQTPEVKVWTVTAKDTGLYDIDPAFAESTKYYLWLLQAHQRDYQDWERRERRRTRESSFLSWLESESPDEEDVLEGLTKLGPRDCGQCSALDFLKYVEHRSTTGSAALKWRQRWVPLF